MLLSKLNDVLGLGSFEESSDPEILDLTQDSRAVKAGWMFACVKGETTDGHDFAVSAVADGASALLVERPQHAGVPELVVADPRIVMAPAAAAIHGHPSRYLRAVGVTGTSGKTTVTALLGQLLELLGESTAVVGTLSGSRTTPEAPLLQRQLRLWLAEGITAVAMEVSSHALMQHRVDAMTFEVVVFLNLSPEHLDYHHTMEEYYAAKLRLFTEHSAGHRLVCTDDVWGERLVRHLGESVTTFGLHQLSQVESSSSGSRFVWRGQRVELPIPGVFNIANAQAAGEIALLLGYEAAEIAPWFSHLKAIPGRLEPIDEGQSFDVVVDYAHKPAALEMILREARTMSSGRVLVVMGCGGDRDAQKRPEMGRIATELADISYITSDNPRHELPDAIISEIVAGVPSGQKGKIHTIVDRAAAIRSAIHDAVAGDFVVIAGKGHETTQTFADRVVNFDDREVARAALRDELEVPL